MRKRAPHPGTVGALPVTQPGALMHQRSARVPRGDKGRAGSQGRDVSRVASLLQWPVGLCAGQPGARVAVRQRTIRWAGVAGLIWRTMLIVTVLPLTISW